MAWTDEDMTGEEMDRYRRQIVGKNGVRAKRAFATSAATPIAVARTQCSRVQRSPAYQRRMPHPGIRLPTEIATDVATFTD
jgi:hypothetical protein